MPFERSRKRKFGETVLTPIPAPPTPIQVDIPRQTKILSRDRLIKPTPSTDKTKLALNRNQQRCTFFKLPAEIRTRIYTIALGNLYIRIEYKPHEHRIRQKNLKRYKEHIVGDLWYHCYEITSNDLTKVNVNHNYSVSFPHRRKLTLPARTCRQMYMDTALLHFELNVFSFHDEWVMRKWMAKLKPVQKRALRRLDLGLTWDVNTTLGKSLTGLRAVWFLGGWVDVQRFIEEGKDWWIEMFGVRRLDL